jgi:15-cis-phytoene synthase
MNRSQIIMGQEQERAAYEYCRQVTRQASKTFYWGSAFLPPAKRCAVWAIYALCRTVDDIVDEAACATAPRIGHLQGAVAPAESLDYWRRALERIYQGYGDDKHPIQCAWMDMLTRYPVPLYATMDLLNGVEMDLTRKRYRSFDDLYVYCYRVAGTVGLLTSPIFGYHCEEALTHAVELGVALQLTNILRDIGEDARRGRIYLPQEEMERFGYSEEELLAGTVNETFCELLRFQIARAEEYYLRAQPGIALLNQDCRLAVSLSGTLYHNILDRIRLNKYNVFTRRASVPLKTKLVTASQQWVLQQFEMRRDLHRA